HDDDDYDKCCKKREEGNKNWRTPDGKCCKKNDKDDYCDNYSYEKHFYWCRSEYENSKKYK
ncbi:MAG: hypothetical protein E7E72_18835, partial [Clostridium sp.]|nr:hypothetical protein [Clostridium sp.]